MSALLCVYWLQRLWRMVWVCPARQSRKTSSIYGTYCAVPNIWTSLREPGTQCSDLTRYNNRRLTTLLLQRGRGSRHQEAAASGASPTQPTCPRELICESGKHPTVIMFIEHSQYFFLCTKFLRDIKRERGGGGQRKGEKVFRPTEIRYTQPHTFVSYYNVWKL